MTDNKAILLIIIMIIGLSVIGGYFGLSAETTLTATTIGEAVDKPDTVVNAWDFLLDTIDFFWDCVTFQIDGTPIIFSYVFLVLSILLIYLIAKGLRGVAS